MRVFTAMRSLQTAVPLGVCRSSGSRVRLPTSTTRLMFAMVLRSFLGVLDGLGSELLQLDGFGRRAARGCAAVLLRAARRHVADHAVRDLQHPRHLTEGLRGGFERQQVVRAFALVVDLVRELAPAPGLVRNPAPAAALDQLAGAREYLVLALL